MNLPQGPDGRVAAAVPSVDPLAAPAATAMLAIEKGQSRNAHLDGTAEDATLSEPAASDQRVEC